MSLCKLFILTPRFALLGNSYFIEWKRDTVSFSAAFDFSQQNGYPGWFHLEHYINYYFLIGIDLNR
jgi:hypothetical protein